MAHTRSSRLKTRLSRYRISDDVLTLILGWLDPRSLLMATKAFKRIYAIVMAYHSLRYTFELAVSGMRDGAAPRAVAPLIGRLHLLMSYRTDWPRFNWTHEYKMQIVTPSHIGTSSGFIHQIRPHGVYDTLEITELPSCRTGRSPTLTRRLRFTSPPIETICIDASQALVIAAHIFWQVFIINKRPHNSKPKLCSQGGIVGVQLHFRDLWTFGKHPRALAESYEIPTQSAKPVFRAAISIFGSKMAMTLEFVGGKVHHLIMDWRNFGARWIDDQDVRLLDEDLLLVVCKRGPMINLCSISNIANMVVLRQYELPAMWTNSTITLCANHSPHLPPASALFYSDPAHRILVISAKPTPKSTSCSWLFVNEAYFRAAAPSRRDRFAVPWSVWGQYCLIKDLFRSGAAVRGPYVVGSRVVFLEPEARARAGAGTLNAIEFVPFPENPARLDPSWSTVGPRSPLFPSETARRLPSSAVEHYAVDDIGVTEDNIVLFLELRPGFRPVNILTFGAPSGPAHR
ncbi:F-box domain-containing protein [Mycena sanguinolenta]|uniref:F-box domain-containing protein n=1 Tax=Mycena sanguinolenta TaxID=230812 RepID=A0A8H7DFP8_9AGAR|nr:F-box domain-containing protein [Mycena sanguinolenta]